ncbi:MAG: zinc ribbon domain-containing protein [Nitrososphaeria archaeon]|jgi:RNA polymerase subunit RPABC4/transcription elongation factor Spt4
MANCSNCGREIPDDSKLCPYCGTTLIRSSTNIKFCPECRKVVPIDALLCPYCGTKLPTSLMGKFLCPKCKREIPKNALLCPYCGIIIEEGTSRITKKVQKRNVVKYVVVSLIIVLIVLTIIFIPIIPQTYSVKGLHQVTKTNSEVILSDKDFVISPKNYTWWLVNVPSGRTIVFDVSANQTTTIAIQTTVIIRDTLYAYVLNQSDFTSYKQGTLSNASHYDVGSNMRISFTTGSNCQGNLYFVIANQADPAYLGFVPPPPRKIFNATASITWQQQMIVNGTVEHTKYVSLLQLLTGTV